MTKTNGTGRVWICPKCGFVLREGDVPYAEAVCRRTQGCRRSSVQMKVSESEGE